MNNKFKILLKKEKYKPSHGFYEVYKSIDNGREYVLVDGVWNYFYNGEPEGQVKSNYTVDVLDEVTK